MQTNVDQLTLFTINLIFLDAFSKISVKNIQTFSNNHVVYNFCSEHSVRDAEGFGCSQGDPGENVL